MRANQRSRSTSGVAMWICSDLNGGWGKIYNLFIKNPATCRSQPAYLWSNREACLVDWVYFMLRELKIEIKFSAAF